MKVETSMLSSQCSNECRGPCNVIKCLVEPGLKEQGVPGSNECCCQGFGIHLWPKLNAFDSVANQSWDDTSKLPVPLPEGLLEPSLKFNFFLFLKFSVADTIF